MSSRPNVLLIIIDQFRADLLDGRLAEIAGLKNLAALADEAFVFRDHYSVVTPCGPSRVSLFTGQYAMNHRAVRNGTPLRHDTPNLAREMRAAGYDPLLFGYTDIAQDPRALPEGDPRLTSYEELLDGFTEALRMRQESDDSAWRDDLRAKGYEVPDGNDLYVPDGDDLTSPARYRAEDSDTAFLTDRFLDRMGGEDPGWFATLTYIRPHPPFVAPAPFNALINPDDLPAPAQTLDNEAHPFTEALRGTEPISSKVEGFLELEDSPKTVAKLRATYLGLAAEVDQHIGRVLDWLKASGQWDDTILIVTADHGEMLGDHGLWGKKAYYDASYKIPLMIRIPGESPREMKGMSESIDVSPTILDLVGRTAPDAMNGTSLRGMMAGGDGKAFSFSEHDFGDPIEPSKLQQALGLSTIQSNYAVLRSKTHRLVHFAGDLPQVLFDMTGDGELRDISALPNAQAICLDLSRQMLCHRMVHPESTFAKTMVVDGGVKTGPAQR